MTDDYATTEELESLKARVSALEEIVEQDDGNPSGETAAQRAAYLDRYDAAVVECLEEGVPYHVRALKNMYLQETTIRNNDTATERVRSLIKQRCFENVGGAKHEFLGVEE